MRWPCKCTQCLVSYLGTWSSFYTRSWCCLVSLAMNKGCMSRVFLVVSVVNPLAICPEGRLGIPDYPALASTLWPGISGLSFNFPFLSPALFFCLVLLLFLSSVSPPPVFVCLAHGPFSWLFPQKILQYFWLRDGLFVCGFCWAARW